MKQSIVIQEFGNKLHKSLNDKVSLKLISLFSKVLQLFQSMESQSVLNYMKTYVRTWKLSFDYKFCSWSAIKFRIFKGSLQLDGKTRIFLQHKLEDIHVQRIRNMYPASKHKILSEENNGRKLLDSDIFSQNCQCKLEAALLAFRAHTVFEHPKQAFRKNAGKDR